MTRVIMIKNKERLLMIFVIINTKQKRLLGKLELNKAFKVGLVTVEVNKRSIARRLTD